MLNYKKFKSGLSLLEQNYDRTLTDAIEKIWFQYLDEHLTDEEFLTAVKHVIIHSRFMPTPAELVEHIHGSKEAQALQEWQLVLKASARGGAQEQLAYLSDRGRVALQAIGGLHAVGAAEDFQRQRMEKSFVTVFCQCSTKDRKTLAQASVEAPVEVAKEVDEPAPMPEHLKVQMEALKAKFAMSNGSK